MAMKWLIIGGLLLLAGCVTKRDALRYGSATEMTGYVQGVNDCNEAWTNIYWKESH